ncbi:MAG: hypothetical protein ACJA2D_001686, partial [Pseudohongiellaceae bacterium]
MLRYNFLFQHMLTLLAFSGLFIALSLPNQLIWITPAAFIYFPLELVLIGLLLLLPGRWGKVMKVALAILLGISILLRAADLASHEVLGRPFDLIFDSHLLADGGQVLSGALGELASVAVGFLLFMLSGVLCWLAFAMLGRAQQVLQSDTRRHAFVLVLLLTTWCVLERAGWSRTGSLAFD